MANTMNKRSNLPLKILHWNAGGMSQSKQIELEQVLHSKNIDVFCIVEANMSQQVLASYNFPYYKTYLLPKYRKIASGILVGIHNSLTSFFKEVKVMGNTNDKSEVVEVNVWKNCFKFKIYSVYSPPMNRPEFNYFNFSNKTIIIGDFNAHFRTVGYADVNHAGKAVEDIIHTTNMELIFKDNDTPSYLHYNGTTSNPDLLLVSSDITQRTTKSMIEDPGTGHRMMIVEVDLNKCGSNNRQKLKASWNFKKANWDNFSNILEKRMCSELIDFYQYPDKVYDEIKSIITTIAKENIPYGKVKKYSPFWSNELDEIKKTRDIYRAEAETYKTQEAVSRWKKQAALMKRSVNQAKRIKYNSFVNNMDVRKDSSKVYGFMKSLTNEKTSFHKKTPIRKGNLLISNDKDISNEFVKFYCNSQKKSIYVRNKSRELKKSLKLLFGISNKENANTKNNIFTEIFKIHELNIAISQLKPKTSPGSDGVHSEFFIHMKEEARKTILKLFNYIWITGIIPTKWKQAVVIPILKKDKDPFEISSYRPVSLTSVAAKLMERLVNNRLNWYLESNSLLSNSQAGFRSNRSTNEHVVTLSQHIKDSMDKGNILTAVFVDFKGAYNCVWRELLLTKLAHFGVKNNMLRWFQQFLSQRSIRVKYQDFMSSSKILQTGIPQGTVTSCSLFNIYINDLEGELKKVPGVECLMYADDIVFWTEVTKRNGLETSEKTLNDALCALSQWSLSNGMIVSTEKTQFQTFSLAHHQIQPNLTYNGEVLYQKDDCKYLGVIFDNKLTWKSQIENLATKASKRLTLLKKLGGTTWGSNRSTLLTTYKMYVKPKLIYCCEALITAKKLHLNKLEIVQNQALRLITGAVKTTPIDAMLLLTKIITIDSTITQSSLILYEKMIRLSKNTFWKNYNVCNRKLKTQAGFIQKVQELRESYNIVLEPECDMEEYLENPLNVTNLDSNLHLTTNKSKSVLNKNELKAFGLETINSRYPQNEWLHVFTDGSKLNANSSVGAGVYSKVFSASKSLSNTKQAFDGEIAAIKLALSKVLHEHQNIDKIVILTDSKASIESIMNCMNHTKSKDVAKCRSLIYALKYMDKTVTLQWIPSHCNIEGNELADQLAKNGASSIAVECKTVSFYGVKSIIKSNIKTKFQKELFDRTSNNDWFDLQDIPEFPRKDAVAIFRMKTGHDCLARHLHRFGLVDSPNCTLCRSGIMDKNHLKNCTFLTKNTLVDRYWEARSNM
jgi:ribonuclease HI